jgi:hypothetical protein
VYECPICLNQFTPSDDLVRPGNQSCVTHLLHRDCASDHRLTQCPICRAPIERFVHAESPSAAEIARATAEDDANAAASARAQPIRSASASETLRRREALRARELENQNEQARATQQFFDAQEELDNDDDDYDDDELQQQYLLNWQEQHLPRELEEMELEEEQYALDEMRRREEEQVLTTLRQLRVGAAAAAAAAAAATQRHGTDAEIYRARPRERAASMEEERPQRQRPIRRPRVVEAFIVLQRGESDGEIHPRVRARSESTNDERPRQQRQPRTRTEFYN